MRQTLHIFRKDVRHLRWEVALLLALVAAVASGAIEQRSPIPAAGDFSWINSITQFLLVTMILLLPGRLVHAEALPGEKQFWLTRPYSRGSLLGAKCLFLFAFVVVPMTISDIVLVERGGFSVIHELPGLVWEQVLRIGLILVPALALAAITRNAVQQIFTALGLGVLFSVSTWPAEYAAQPLEWVYRAIAAVLVASFAAGVVAWQYARRGTIAARVLFGSGAVLAIAAAWIPWKVELPIQSLWDQKVVDPAKIRIELDPSQGKGPLRGVVLPLHVSGVPEGFSIWTEPRWDIQGDRNRTQIGGLWSVVDESQARVALYPPLDILAQFKDRPVTLRATALITVGKQRMMKLPTAGERAEILEAGFCEWAEYGVVCRRPFRHTPRIGASYSPLPAELLLDPIVTDREFRITERRLALTLDEPVQHFLYHFEFDNVRLADYIIEPKIGTR